jgi:hypothetical protein
MASWITEGVSSRARARPDPLMHLLVGDDRRMWCSSGRGRPDAPGGYLKTRWCRGCRTLAQEAASDGDLGPSDISTGWRVAFPSPEDEDA